MRRLATVAVSEVAEINPTLSVRLKPDDYVAFVGMADLDANAAIASDSEQRRYADVSKGYTPFLREDILVAKITPCFENMKIGQAATSTQVAFGSTEFHVARAKDDRVDPRYLLHFLRQRVFLALGALRMTGSGGQRRVPERVFDELQIPLPKISDQRRIAAVLDAADALRAKRRQALAKLDTLTQAIFVDMFGSGGTNPHGYPVVSMVDLVDPKRPITYGILKPGDDLRSGIPYVRVVDMANGSINVEGLRRTSPEISAQYKRSLLQTGDLLLSIRGHVGRLALVDDDVAGANITQDTARLAVAGAEPVYVLELLRSAASQRWMAAFTKGAAVRGINLTDVKKLPVIVPPKSEQMLFAERARLVGRVKSQQATALRKLDDQFFSLQQRAFSGEL